MSYHWKKIFITSAFLLISIESMAGRRFYRPVLRDGRYSHCSEVEVNDQNQVVERLMAMDEDCKPANMHTIFMLEVTTFNYQVRGRYCREVDSETLGRRWNRTELNTELCTDQGPTPQNQRMWWTLERFPGTPSHSMRDCYSNHYNSQGAIIKNLVANHFCEHLLITHEPIQENGSYAGCRAIHHSWSGQVIRRELAMDLFCRPRETKFKLLVEENTGQNQCYEVDRETEGQIFKTITRNIFCDYSSTGVSDQQRRPEESDGDFQFRAPGSIGEI